MSTRKLILLALACGLAILFAGSIQLLRIKDNDAATLAEGDSTELSTATASVLSSEVRDGGVWVTVRLAQAPAATATIDDALTGWSFLTGGLQQPVAATGVVADGITSCAGLAVAPGAVVECTQKFAATPTTRGSSVVTFVFVGRRATWSIVV